MKKTKVLILGLGDLGGWVLELLAREYGEFEIYTADVNEDWGYRKINSALLGAYQMGYTHNIYFNKIDLNNVEETAEFLKKTEPDIIYNSVSLQSWWVITELPKPVYARIDRARYGPWLPMHLKLTKKLMEAVKMSGIDTFVVNAAFPDAVNPALARIGLSPEVGIGNIDNIVPSITKSVADLYHVPLNMVNVYMLAPHFISYHLARFGSTGGAPYYIQVCLGGKDITAELDLDKIFAAILSNVKRPGSRGAHPVVASSVVKIIMNMIRDTGMVGHAPGPQGLPGGYPVSISSRGVEVIIPGNLTLEQAIKINEEAQKFDGIKEIKEDGTVVFMEESVQSMKDLLGYDCPSLSLAEVDARADELGARFKEFVNRTLKK